MKKAKHSGIVDETIQTTNQIYELRILISFFDFLSSLDISVEAIHIAEEIEDTIVDVFCPDCEETKEDGCGCRGHEYYNDPDAAYDRWKDEQMER